MGNQADTAQVTGAGEERAAPFALIYEPYRSLFASMNHGFCVIERVETSDGVPSDYRYLVANPAFLSQTGLPDPVGKTTLELLPDVETATMDRYDRVVRTGQPERFEAYVSGLDRWMEADVFPTGTPGRIAVLFNDVSDRKRAEEALRAHEERQTFLLKLSDVMRALTDAAEIKAAATRLLAEELDVNRAFYADADRDRWLVTTGYEQGIVPLPDMPFPMKTYGQWIIDDFRAGRPLVVRDVRNDARFKLSERAALEALGIVGAAAVPLVKDDALVGMLALHTAAPRDWNDRELSLIEETAERTWAGVERARAESALRESEERLRRMLNVEGVGVLHFGRDGVLLEANDWFFALTGYRREEIAAGHLHWRTMTPPEYLATTEEEMRRLAEVGRIGPYEKEFLHANGSRFWLLFAGAALGDGSVVEYCLDISDRKRAEAALRASEENYRSLFESIDQGFCTIEVLFDEHDQAIDYVFCETNPAFERNTGLVGVIGKRMRDLAPAHEEHWFQTYGDIALSRQPRRFEAEAASLGRWYNVYAYPVGEPDQHQVAILSEDISERRRAEQSLRESEERYRTIVEEASDYAIFTTDAERRIDSWPAGAQAVLGWSADEAIGQPLDMAFTPEDRAAGIPEREFLIARDSGYAPNERWHIRKDGTRVFVDGSAYPRFDGAGQFLGLFKIGQDTTERRRTDEALRASEEKYRGLFASMNEGFCLYEIIRDDHGKVIDVFIHEANAAYERLTARPNAVGRTLRSIDPSVDDEWLEMMAAVVDKGEPARFTRYSPITGRWFDVRASVQDQGTPPLLALIFTDITERVTAERSLRESEERLQARVTEATDELRTLSRRLLEVHEEERRHLARELHDEIGQVLTGLQFQLATVSAADGERVAEVQKTVQDLTEQVRQLSMDLRPAVLDQYGLLAALRWHIERYGIRTGIKVDLRHEGLEARLPPPVEIAAFRVVQEALTNIVRHAETHEAFVQLLADAEALTVVVRDRGQGFDPASANPSSGLSGMRERVELLGGTLTLDSGPGEGTVIAAEVPLTVSPLLEESL